MKIVKDDGDVLDEFSDNTAVLLIKPEGISAIMKLGRDQEEVPSHIVFAAALMVFLKHTSNRELVSTYAPQKGTHVEHKHN